MGLIKRILENRRRIRAIRRGQIIRLDPSRPRPSKIIRLSRWRGDGMDGSYVITNKELADQHRQIMDLIRDFGEKIVNNQNKIINTVNTIKSDLEKIISLCNEIKHNTVILSDNQSVLSDKLDEIKAVLDKVSRDVERLKVYYYQEFSWGD